MTEPSWKDLEKLFEEASHMEGEAAEAFKQSLVNDMARRGYSQERARQIVEEEVAKRKKR